MMPRASSSSSSSSKHQPQQQHARTASHSGSDAAARSRRPFAFGSPTPGISNAAPAASRSDAATAPLLSSFKSSIGLGSPSSAASAPGSSAQPSSSSSGAGGTSALLPRALARLARYALTVYVLCALVYTAHTFVVKPSWLAVSQSSSSAAAAASPNANEGFDPRELLLAQTRRGDGDGGQDDVPRESDATAAAASQAAAAAAAAAASKAAAGVKEEAIKNEDSDDLVWAAAAKREKLEKANNKKKGKKGAAAKKTKPSEAVYVAPEHVVDGREIVDRRVNGYEGTEWDRDFVAWPKRTDDEHGHLRDGPEPKPMSEDVMLSKTFPGALQPSKVIPYYYRAAKPDDDRFEREDITITTLVTANRFEIFRRMAERYKGPISATVHVSASDGDARAEQLRQLDDLYNSSDVMRDWVDVHLVYDAFERQFNMWRNVAKYFARTDVRFPPSLSPWVFVLRLLMAQYVMMLDVDFWLCTDFRSRILNSAEILTRLKSGLAAFVVPAFEFLKQADGVDPHTFPSSKPDLIELVDQGKIDQFHRSWLPGHNSTDYPRYYRSKPGEVYRVRQYSHSYEPYVIFKKEGTPWCDERFIGYGGNKAACLYELYLSGTTFYVLPDDFLIHQSHAYAEKARQHERRYNRKLYADFREELCFRYLNLFMDQIHTSRARVSLTRPLGATSRC